MNFLEEMMLIEAIKFWINAITIGLMRIAITAACIKFLWG